MSVWKAAALMCLLPLAAYAREINLAALSCERFESDIMNAPAAEQGPVPPAHGAPAAAQGEDAVNVVMWLFGYAVAKSGAQVMYGDALQQFGNALDSQCKINPQSRLADAVATVKLVNSNPMDLNTLGCTTFEERHVEMAKSDPQSADTIMMWLFGYSVGKAGGQSLDSSRLPAFTAALANQCTTHPDNSLYAALISAKLPKTKRAGAGQK